MPKDINMSLKSYEAAVRRCLYDTLVRSVLDYKNAAGLGRPMRVLDVGCGRGEVMRRLCQAQCQVWGIDPEIECVEASGEFGDSRQGSISDIETLFPTENFDVVVCSHVLEHIPPITESICALRNIKAGYYVLAVPNILRVARVLRAVLGSARGDHPTHYFGWGQPEFTTILRSCGLEPGKWYTDRVTVNPFGNRAGGLGCRILEPIEVRLLPRLFPMLSSSLIVGCTTSAERDERIRNHETIKTIMAK